MERTLDRRIHYDPLSRNFPIRELVGPRPPRSYTWRCDMWLDQRSEGACVGFAWAHELVARPKVVPADENLARTIYREAQRLDVWQGEAYSGTSVLAGAKAVHARGHLREYRWAFGFDDLLLAIGYAGPAVLGLEWRTGMWNTDDKGFVHVTGQVVGGHAILAHAVSVKGRYVVLHNSWGTSWGVNGRARISFDDLDALLRDGGEACIPVFR